MFKVLETLEKNPLMMREAYCNTLMEAAKTDENVVALDADLVSSSGMKPFFKEYPDRAFQCPSCNKRTKKGWQHEGEKLVAPLTKAIKKITKK